MSCTKLDMITRCVNQDVLKQINNGKQRPTYAYVNRAVTCVEKNTPCGYCWCKTHFGFLSVSLLRRHDCLGKQCVFLERFDKHPFWEERDKVAKAKAKRKALNNGRSTYMFKGVEYLI